MNKIIKKLICFTVLISIIATALLVVTACDKKTEEQETTNNGGCDSPYPYDSIYRTSETLFDIGDVPIEWSFGWYDVYAENIIGKKTSYIELKFFQNESENTHRFVKRIDEDFFSEKFMIEVHPEGETEPVYHYTETVMIPHKYFLRRKGSIWLIVEGFDILPNGEIERNIHISIELYYVLHDDKIELLPYDQWYRYVILL